MTERPSPRRPPAARPIAARPVARRGAATAPMRRSRPVRRASAGLSPVRAGAMLVLLVSAAAIYGVAHSTAFGYSDLRVEGADFTPRADIEAVLEMTRGENLFLLRSAPLEERVARLDGVRAAKVSVSLPGTLVVRVAEREPILVWRVGARRYLVDRDGRLFALLGDTPSPAAAGLPVVEDRRAASAGLSIGRTIDPVDLDAATRLASLQPSDVGSEAVALSVIVSDANGFVIRSGESGWAAIFGFYTPTLRTPELIPGQVRLLRSLLIGREAQVERVILATETDGTYVAKPTPTPRPTSSARPTSSKAPRPTSSKAP